ncbi:pyridoxal phosphate-dependent aminotransferase [Austwickia sp. TVS 96-490-7B]|uniref:pyridoxal phosphate-dependent aminotransferase n=1 Tax=Austwickia sp. TVS 96-490-7B TaxID=2830843 RepID=UPI001C56CFCE|nr:pyridoxal phosphate-dependent aminotransferase [Austwickia sp. TVS 96-490-7B]
MRQFTQSAKLQNVCYDIRGPVMQAARQMEDEGHHILKLNIGNTAPFGFTAPDALLIDMIRELPDSAGYCDANGIVSARRAIAHYHAGKGLSGLDLDDIFLGNGVSELITMSLQALLDTGDEVLLPAPDYPLYTASVALAGGTPVHYVCDEQADWAPDLDDIEAKITDRTTAIVVINPNNPTGAVYPREVLEGIVEIARRHQLLIFSDEIYDKIVYDDAEHVSTASLAPDLLCLTFNGLSKAYRVPGFRCGWMVLSGPKEHARDYIEGLSILSNMRLCANHPAQRAVVAALSGPQSIEDLIRPGGRLLAQRDLAHEMLNAIPGVSCTKPKGALYAFPRLDPAVYQIDDDERFVLELLRAEKMLVVQGTGFNFPTHDHLRIVTLPHVEDLAEAMHRFERFLGTYRQQH